MENLVTKPLEKQVKSIKDVEKVTSNSLQDFSNIIIEFDTNVDVEVAKQRVKDAVDKAKPDLPTDLPDDPEVIDIDISQIPIMNINLSGDYDLIRLKEYAEDMRSEEHTSELQSLMRISYAVFCLKKKTKRKTN